MDRHRFAISLIIAGIVWGCSEPEQITMSPVAKDQPVFLLAPASNDRFGVNVVGLSVYTATEQRMIAGLARQAGFKWARLPFTWPIMQPVGPYFDAGQLAAYHSAIQALVDSGLTPYVSFEYTPPWARNCVTEQDHERCSRYYPPAPEMWIWWQNFVWQSIEEFGGQVKHWGVWNEPNELGFLKPILPDTTWNVAYRLLFLYAADVIQLDPSNVLVAPEISNGMSSRGWTPEAEFADFVATLGYRMRPQDVFAVHNYGKRQDVLALLSSYNATLNAANIQSKIWVTEFGAGDGEVDDEHQSRRNIQYYQAMMHDVIPRWTKSFKFHLWESDGAANSRQLVSNVPANPQPRLAYNCIRAFARQDYTPAGCTGNFTATINTPVAPACTFTSSTNLTDAPLKYRWIVNGVPVGSASFLSIPTQSNWFTITLSVLDGDDDSAIRTKTCLCTPTTKFCHE